MMRRIIKFLLMALVIMGISYILPGIHVQSFWSALGLAVVLSIINLIIRPIFVLLTLPITILTLGVFLFFINGLMLLLASAFVGGVVIDSFWIAFLASILLSIANWIIQDVLA